MAFIYTVTFRTGLPEDPAKPLTLQLVATDQVKALSLATEKAAELQLKLARLEEIQALQAAPRYLDTFFLDGKEFLALAAS